ncbi:MAG: alpha/beta hydrolase [Candidatus Zixiibacteriota bacterium]|nr:MAG: alpha/beta hydrolase [candidate division Zixibacteria bacterium]
MLHFIGIIAIIFAGGYVVFALILFFMQARFVFVPSREIEADPSDIGLRYENVDFVSPDIVDLHGWYIPAEKERAVLLFCHGNAGNISHRLESIQLFNRLGLSVFIFDYRGYGRSGGEPSEEGTYKDAVGAWQWLIDKKQYAPERIVVFGRSLGGAVAAHLASEKNPKVLIIESAFTSVGDMGARIYPYMPVKLLIRYHYRTIDYIDRVKCPVMVIHSPDDELVSFKQGRRLYDAAREPKEFLEITGGHNGGFLEEPDIYSNGFDSFLRQYVDDKLSN